MPIRKGNFPRLVFILLVASIILFFSYSTQPFSLTGFAIKDFGGIKYPPTIILNNSTDASNQQNTEMNGLNYTYISEDLPIIFNEINQSNASLPKNSRSSGGGHRNPPSNRFPPFEGNQSSNYTFPGNLTLPKLKQGSIKKMPSGLKLKFNNSDVSTSEIFQGKNRFKLNKNNFIISEFDLNVENDTDISDIIADIDFSTGKTFMHSTSGQLQTIHLYVPRLPNQNGVIVCANASKFSEITQNCSEISTITSEYILREGDPNLEISSDGNYYIIKKITGTGAQGANVTSFFPEVSPSDLAENATTYAGNITSLNVFGISTTQTWQGFYGNVSGVIELSDLSGAAMYNWTTLQPLGQIYASTNSSVNWNTLQCFNFTSLGTYVGIEIPGNYSLFGTNITQLEFQFNIDPMEVDGVDETFNQSGPNTHDTFYASHIEFSEGKCQNTQIFSDSGKSENNKFEEVLLYDYSTESIIFTSLLRKEDQISFNNKSSDFQMLVLENGHNDDVAATPYYFFIELS